MSRKNKWHPKPVWGLYPQIWYTVHSAVMASDALHLPVTPCSSESFLHNYSAPGTQLSYSLEILYLFWCDWIHCSQTVGGHTESCCGIRIYCLKYGERRAARWGGREVTLRSWMQAHAKQHLWISLSIIPSLIQRCSVQSFEAGHNPWPLGPNLSPRPVRSPPQTAPAGCQHRSGRLSLLQRDS